MKRITFQGSIIAASLALALLHSPRLATAHCDTLDGPVIKDARLALEKGDITPVLKWVHQKDEPEVKKAFEQALAATKKDAKAKESGEHRFFETLVKVHRAGEGAPFTGLKQAGEVEPVIAEADRAVATGSPDGLIRMVTDAVSQGIRHRYEKVAEALRHKDESVQKGREYVEAYVDYTHYVERIQQDAEGHSPHHQEPSAGKEHKLDSGHEEGHGTKHH